MRENVFGVTFIDLTVNPTLPQHYTCASYAMNLFFTGDEKHLTIPVYSNSIISITVYSVSAVASEHVQNNIY